MFLRHLSLYYLLGTVALFSMIVNSSNENRKGDGGDDDKISYALGFKVDVVKKAKYCIRKAEEGDVIFFHSEGRVIETNFVFDSSRKKNMPYTMQLGKKHVISPVEKVMVNICAGDRRRLTMPYATAYGDSTFKSEDGSLLDKNSTLEFDLEVVEIQPPPDVNILFNAFDQNKTGKIPIDEVIKGIISISNKPGFPIKLPTEQLGALLESAFQISDKDGDKSLSLEEFNQSLLMDNDPEASERFEEEMKDVFPTKPQDEQLDNTKPMDTTTTSTDKETDATPTSEDEKTDTPQQTKDEL